MARSTSKQATVPAKAKTRKAGKAQAKAPAPSMPPFVVGIGASAGGLKSVTALLKALPPATDMSLIIVQHMDRDQVSGLPGILARATDLPVTEITDGVQIERGCVYIAPPGHDISVKDGTLGLQLRQKRAALDGQVDKFFCSLARCLGDRAIAVILSGTGNDGASGARVIKESGGLVFAEAENSAEYYGMPGSAILAGAVDHVLPPLEIARKLARLARDSVRTLRPPQKPPIPAESRDQPLLDRIFEVLKTSRNVDFADYKPSTLRRRITRRMALRRVDKLDAYVEFLRKDPKEVDDLFRDLLINVTGFFRDKPAFRALSKQILPEIVAAKRDGDALRIWVPGCATGEEVYSIGICVSEVLAAAGKTLKVQIFGTDLSDWAITRARSGLYSAAAMAAVTSARQRRFFDRVEDSFRIRRSIREMCTFAQQNLCEDPPFSRMDLISCRNVMIYLGPKLQRKCVPIFYYALNPHGILMLGVSETIGSFADLFTLMDKKNKIYQKKSSPLTAERRLKDMPLTEPKPLLQPPPKAPRKLAPVRTERETSIDLQTAADHLILTHFAPCGVVIDTRLQVWHFRGYTAPFLEHAPGAASLNILKLVRHSMAPDLSAAVHQALKTGVGVRKECLVADSESVGRTVAIEVVPFNVGASPEQWLLVIFEFVPTTIPLPLATDSDNAAVAEAIYAREVERLRAELAATKDSLQSIIEEQEAANDEIKSANEEIESSNEELQSTNEELETAKEELQSTNEELSTVNEELNQRNHEINEINNDLNNLLSSINIAIVMVDNQLTIRRTTPLAEKLFNIIPTDLGRKLTDINPNLDMPMLPKLIRSVIDNLAPLQEKVFDSQGGEYSLRVRPYRTRENVINGVVITLVDIKQPSKTPAAGESH